MVAWLNRLVAGPEYGYPAGEPARSDPAPAPPPAANTAMRVASNQPCFPFHLQLTVRFWQRESSAVTDAFRIAQGGIRRRAQEITRRYPVTEHDRVHEELELALGSGVEVDQTGVVASASCNAVTAQAEFIEAIKRYEALRRVETTRSWHREAEDAEIAHLAKMFGDPRRATAWWFNTHREEITRLPEIAQLFITLQSTLTEQDEQTPDALTADSWDRIFADFQAGSDPSARNLLEYQIKSVLRGHGMGDLAERARLLDGNPVGEM